MSESALNKSTMITQFKEYYDKSQTLLLENQKYLHLDIHKYIGKNIVSVRLHLYIKKS